MVENSISDLRFKIYQGAAGQCAMERCILIL